MNFADTGRFPAENSAFLQLLRLEKEEIDKLKWLESERLGVDCGRDYADFIWVMRGHRQRWVSGMKAAGLWPV